MRGLKRAKRVRIHLTAVAASAGAESVEGLLIARRRREYIVAMPELLVAAGARNEPLPDARELVIPREHVAHYEVLR
jgi:hypothetical protein